MPVASGHRKRERGDHHVAPFEGPLVSVSGPPHVDPRRSSGGRRNLQWTLDVSKPPSVSLPVADTNDRLAADAKVRRSPRCELEQTPGWEYGPTPTSASTTQHPPQDTLKAVYAFCTYMSPENDEDADDDSRNVVVDAFLGTCIAVSSDVVITAGHHFREGDAVETLGVAATHSHGTWISQSKGTSLDGSTPGQTSTSGITLLARATHVQKASRYDVLVVWLDRALPFHVPLRALHPQPGASVWTAWLSRLSYHSEPIILTPGTVSPSHAFLDHRLRIKGATTDYGSSGAPVFCAYRGVLVGIHIGCHFDKKEHVKEAVPASILVQILALAGVRTRRPTVPTAADNAKLSSI